MYVFAYLPLRSQTFMIRDGYVYHFVAACGSLAMMMMVMMISLHGDGNDAVIQVILKGFIQQQSCQSYYKLFSRCCFFVQSD